ncbi:MAG: hypothetical protein ACRC2O_03530, partial [Chitinophagaceae bacterium]
LLFDIFLLFERFLFTQKEIIEKGNANIVAYIAVISFLILGVYNYKKYYNKFNFYKTYWKNESIQERRKKGILVILCMITPWVPLILLGVR